MPQNNAAENEMDSTQSRFSSRRERRLWLLTLAVVVAIYATLGLAATLAGLLQDHNLIGDFFVICFFLTLVALAFYGLRIRPRGIEVGVILGIITVYLLLFARMATSAAERTHLIEYSIVAILVYEALKERANNGRRVPCPALLAIAITALIGILDECIQAFLPNRVFDPVDMLFNVLAAVMAIAAVAALAWARQRGEQMLRR